MALKWTQPFENGMAEHKLLPAKDVFVIIDGEEVGVDSILSTKIGSSELESALKSKVDKVSGKGLSTEDFTSALKSKLESLSNYDDTDVRNLITSVQNALNTLVGSGDTSAAINTFNEVIAFLNTFSKDESLTSVLASLKSDIESWVENKNYLTEHQDISGKVDVVTNPEDGKQYVMTSTGWQEVQIKSDAADITYTPDGGEQTTVAEALETMQSDMNGLSQDLSEVMQEVAGLSKVLDFKGDATDTLLSSINDESIVDVKVGDAYRWASDTIGNIAPHNATGSVTEISLDDVLFCVSVEENHIDGAAGKCTKWCIIQANISETQLKAQIQNLLTNIQDSFDWFATYGWQGEGEPTMEDYNAWLRKPAEEGKSAALAAAQAAIEALDSTGRWVELTKAEYDILEAEGRIVQGVKYIITDEGTEGALVRMINKLFVHCTRVEYNLIKAGTPPEGFEPYFDNAYYFITDIELEEA